MAHSIRGTINYFLCNHIDLSVQVIADTVNAINLQDPSCGATSVLRTKYTPPASEGARAHVGAQVFIHRDANKHLARLCIAHELYHLILELDHFVNSKRVNWTKIAATPLIESQCNQFAWQLCMQHDRFNRDPALLAKHVFFPDHAFDKPLNTHSTKNSTGWPIGIALNPSSRFY